MELGGNSTVGALPTPVNLALDALSIGLDHLVKLVEDGGLELLDDAGLVGFLQGFEQLRNRLPLVDHQLIGDATRRGLPEVLCQSSLAIVLASALRISIPEAARRVRTAEALTERRSMTGSLWSPCGRTWRRRNAPVRSPRSRCRLSSVPWRGWIGPGSTPPISTPGKTHRFAHQFGPKDLRRLAEQVVDHIDPDGTLPDEKLQRDRRHFDLRTTKDGGYAGKFRLTAECGARLTALLGPLAKPRVNATTGPNGKLIEEPDPRHQGQRMHDALEDVCDRLLRSQNPVPDSGGTPATVIITIDIEDLLAKTGYGVTGDGTLIRTATVAGLADSAEVYTAVCTGQGEVLRLGRTRRIATRGQTVALIARDQGCSFPGCDTAPDWCERHHIVSWVDGGKTDLNNLTLLCRYHHHNFATRGWDCQINPDGLPEWRPPWWIDQSRTPMINRRIRSALAARQHRRQ